MSKARSLAADILEAQAGMSITDSSLAATRSTMTTCANSSKRHKDKQPRAESTAETAIPCTLVDLRQHCSAGKGQRDQQGNGDEDEERDPSNN